MLIEGWIPRASHHSTNDPTKALEYSELFPASRITEISFRLSPGFDHDHAQMVRNRKGKESRGSRDVCQVD